MNRDQYVVDADQHNMANSLYNFTIFPQSYDYGCWLASTYSLNHFDLFNPNIGLPAPISLYGDHGVTFDESWLGPNRGLLLEASVIQAFKDANKLDFDVLNFQTYKIGNQIDRGPVMIIGEITNVGFHCFIIHGVKGDSVYVADPMPVNKGNKFKTTFAELRNTNPRAFQYMLWKRS